MQIQILKIKNIILNQSFYVALPDLRDMKFSKTMITQSLRKINNNKPRRRLVRIIYQNRNLESILKMMNMMNKKLTKTNSRKIYDQ